MKLTRYGWITLGLVATSAAISLVLYPHLPDVVPSHFDLHGNADGYSSRLFASIFGPAVLASIWLVFLVLPAISPRGFLMESFQRAWGMLQIAVMLFLAAVSTVISLKAMGYAIPIDRFLAVMLGLLFMGIGNYLGKVTRNFFVGIRTPWTLANEEVWLRTHRLGGKLFVTSGLLIAILGVAGVGLVLMFPLILAAAIIPVVYSYVIYKTIEGTR